MRTIRYLYERVEIQEHKKAVTEKSITILKKEVDGEADMSLDKREEARQRRDRQLLAFYNALFEFDSTLVDEQHLEE